jgi:integrase
MRPPAAGRPLGDADCVAGPRDIQAEGIDPGDAERLHARKTNRNSLANRVLKTLASQAGLDSHVTFHLSRHAAAWKLYQNVGDIYKVSKFLGHSEVEQMQGYIDGSWTRAGTRTSSTR